MSLTDDAMEQVERLFRENVELRQRAETAERELAEMRERIEGLGDEWNYETLTRTGWRRCSTTMTEEYARKRAGDSDRNRLVHRKATPWRVADEEVAADGG